MAYTDGGGMKGAPSACACVIYLDRSTNTGYKEFHIGRPLGFDVTNNEAEYEGIILALEYAKKLLVTRLKLLTDSQLIAHQVRGEWSVKKEHLIPYWERVITLGKGFETVQIDWIPRDDNMVSDALCWKAKALANGSAILLRK